jgi:hypothetical protein
MTDPYAGLRADLGDAMGGGDVALSRADRLCLACVRLLDVDGAAISVMSGGSTYGTFGSSDQVSRDLDELQFTFGEGPCMDAVREGGPVQAENLEDPAEQRWPAYSSSALGLGIRALYALPIGVAHSYIGVLDLYRREPGPLLGHSLVGGLMAAELATLPLMDLIGAEAALAIAPEYDLGWDQVASLARVEVYQATGMIMAQLGIGAADALVRLRAHAFAHDLTASQVAWAIVERHLVLESDITMPPSRGSGEAT